MSVLLPRRRASRRRVPIAALTVAGLTALTVPALTSAATAQPLPSVVAAGARPTAASPDPAVLAGQETGPAVAAAGLRRSSASSQRSAGQATVTGGVPWKPIPTRGIGTPQSAVQLPADYDVQPSYLPQNSCQNTEKPGAVVLRDLLLRTYPGTGSYGISTGCTGRSHVSEHLEGRAFDWKVDVTDPVQKAQAETFLFWLTAVDGAMARRLGVMYAMWDGRIWGAYSPERGWRAFTCSGANACHRNHVHISLTWDGAWARTSFWTGRAVTVADRGPCVRSGEYFAVPYGVGMPNTQLCRPWKPLYPSDAVFPMLRANANRNVSLRERSNAIRALTRVLGGEPASIRSTYLTGQELAAFQYRRGIQVTGTVTPDTWRELARYASGGAVTW